MGSPSIAARAAAAVLLATAPSPVLAAVPAPTLKWANGGCLFSPSENVYYCDTGWYSSPAVEDLDGDGQKEVIWGGYDVFVLSGSSGAIRSRGDSGQRIWPGVAVADLTGDGSLEIVVGRGGDQVTAYRFAPASGVLTTVWQRTGIFGSGEVRTLAVADLDHNGTLEVVAGRASGGDTKQLAALSGATGATLSGWPARRDGELGFGWGMYNNNVAIADLDGDGDLELIGPTDTHYITALDHSGNQLLASPIYDVDDTAPPPLPWSRVGVHVDHAVDLRGYANCGTEHRPNFANVGPAIGDLDNDGTPEIVVPGDVYNCAIGDGPGDLYYLPWVFERDRTRWVTGPYNWTVLPTPDPGSGPLIQGQYDTIEDAVVNTVLADLDGDGVKEILYASYDGRLHAWWVSDKTEHGSWPYDVPGAGIRFASEPVVADLDADGQAEVIFASWPQKGAGYRGQLHILSSLGVPLQAVDLPAPTDGSTWNGGLGAPTLANLDADADLEVVIGTSHTGAVAYDLPGTANARILWATGRGSLKRGGTAEGITVSVKDAPAVPESGGPLAFTVVLSRAATAPVTVQWATTNGTATAGADYTAGGGILTFPAGVTSLPVSVAVVDDTMDEDNETMRVVLSNPSGVLLGDAQGTGTINDDDPMPAVSVSDGSVVEGNAGIVTGMVNVVLSAASSRVVSVSYATGSGSATPGVDFNPASGTVTLPQGATSVTVALEVRGDTIRERLETFPITLSSPVNATIGDAAALMAIGDDDGTCRAITSLPFTITAQGSYCVLRNLSFSGGDAGAAAITINTDFVVLDLKGFKVGGGGAGPGTQASGVYALNRKNVTIKNGSIRGFLRGIYLRDTSGASQGHLVDGVRLHENTLAGIHVMGTGNVVRRNQVGATGGTTAFGADVDTFGIVAEGAGGRVLDNDVMDVIGVGSGTGFSVWLAGADAAVVERNRMGNVVLADAVGVHADSGAELLVMDNRLSRLQNGIVFTGLATGKYRSNLTSGVTVPFTGGTDAGGNE
jgi:Calx-beta domain/Right handed beta helix region/FG-GAP-like repeat